MSEEMSSAPPVSIEQRAGYGVGLGVLGVVMLAVIVVISDSPIEDLVFGLIFTPIFGLVMWLSSRKEAERRVTVLDRITGTDRRRGFRKGLMQAAAVAGLVGLALALVVWAFGPDRGWEVVAAIMLGSALWMALEIRDRRRTEPDA